MALIQPIEAGDSGFALTTATAASFLVYKPNKQEVEWTCSMSNVTTSRMVISHPYAAGDIDLEGQYVVRAKITFPAGDILLPPQAFTVRSRFYVA